MILTCPNCGTKNRVDERRVASEQPVCGRCRARLSITGSTEGAASSEPLEVTDATFGQLLASAGDRPVLVDCWAAWCGPCRMIAPTIDALAAESAGRYVVAKLDVDANQRVAAQFNISSIPALLIFRQGRLVDQLVGVQPKPVIAARLSASAA